MKRILTIALLTALTVASAQTPIAINNLPAAAALNGSEIIPASQSLKGVGLTVSQIQAFLNGANNLWAGAQTFSSTVTFNSNVTFNGTTTFNFATIFGIAPTFPAGSITNSELANSSITINGGAVALGGSRTLTLASGDFANQGTTTTVLHGNASGNPSFAPVNLAADVTNLLPWTSISGAPAIPGFATPTSSVGLTAVNGSASTAMRSDAAPALLQSISPTWTGAHTFSATSPLIVFNASGAVANQKNTDIGLGSTGTFQISSANDSTPSTPVTNALAATRSGNSWLNVALGNATNNPTFSFLGTGATTFGGNVAVSGTALTVNGQNVCQANGTNCPGSITGFANPSASIGLTAVNGSAATAIRSDAAPALSQAITPTWTSAHTFSGTVNLNSEVDAAGVAGTPGQVLSTNGPGVAPSWIAMSGGGGGTGANPTALVGLTAVNGSAGTFIRSDGAPALSQAISPTWTGNHTFTPISGVAVTVNGVASSYSEQISGAATTGQSNGLLVQAGTNATDIGFTVTNKAGSTVLERLFGDAHGSLGPMTWTAGGAFSIPVPTSGNAFAVTGLANSAAQIITGAATSGQSLGLSIGAGTTSADYALQVATGGGTGLFKLFGDGHGYLGPTATSGLSWNAAGDLTANAPSSGTTLNINGVASSPALQINAGGSTGTTNGVLIRGGTNASDYALNIQNGAGTTAYAEIFGDGGLVVGTPTGGDKGLGNINAAGYYINGVPVNSGSVSSVTVTVPAPLTATGCTITTSGTCAITWTGAQTANSVLATPNGSAGAVGLRTLVGADIPAINLAAGGNGGVINNLPYSQISGGPVGATPTANVGLSAVAGSAVTYMRSDGAPALSQSISPTWTGTQGFNGPYVTSTGTTVVSPGQQGITFINSSYGTNAKIWDINQTNANHIQFRAVNDAFNSAASWLDVVRSGAAISSMAFGNTTDKPAITLNGAVTIPVPGSGTALSVAGFPNANAALITGSLTSGQSFGEAISAGTTSADYALSIINASGNTTYTQVRGDGLFQTFRGAAINANSGIPLTVGFSGSSAANAGTIFQATAGATFSIVPDPTSGANGVSLNTSFVAGGNGPIKLAPGGTTAMTLGPLGNVTIAAPSSGSSLTVTGAPGATDVFVPANAGTGGYGLNVTGNAGTSQNILLAGESGFSNGFTVQYDGTQMKYGFNNGNVSIGAPTSGNTLTVSGIAATNVFPIQILGASTAGQSNGLDIQAGNGNSADRALDVLNFNGTTRLFGVFGDGEFRLGFNGSTSTIQGSAAGNVTIVAPGSGNAFTVQGVAAANSAVFNSGGGTGTAFGVIIRGGTNSSDYAYTVQDSTASNTYSQVRGDGLFQAFRGAAITTVSGTALAVTGLNNANTLVVTAGATSGQSFGLDVQGGTTSGDYNTIFQLHNGTTAVQIFGDGGTVVGSPAGGTKGLGTINMTGCFVNGISCSNFQTEAAGIFTSTCTANVSKNISCSSHTAGTGIYNLSVSAAGFTVTPICVVSGNGPVFAQYAYGSSSSTTVQVATYSISGANADEAFAIICVQ